MAVDVPLPHLDRLFDYAVPDELADQVASGCRVKVRFAGRQRDGFVIEQPVASDSDRELSPLLRVVSPEPVLKPEIVAAVRDVADHYAGTFADVVRLAVPPRHGLTENAERPPYPLPRLADGRGDTLDRYPHGASLRRALADGGSPRAALALAPVAEPAGDWTAALVEAAAAALAGGRGALLLVPDAADLARLETRCEGVFGRGSFVTLTAEKGPAARYRAFLAAARGQVRLVLGTRAAAFAPVADLGLIAVYDDGDDSWANHAPPTRTSAWWRPCGRRGNAAGCFSLATAGRPRPRRWFSGAGWSRWRHRWRNAASCARWSGPPTTPSRPSCAIRGRTPGYRIRCSPRSGPDWRPVRSWCRYRGRATWRRSPADDAGQSPGARPAGIRWSASGPIAEPPRSAECAESGRTGTAPSAAVRNCGHPGSASCAPPKSWAAPSHRRRSSSPAAST